MPNPLYQYNRACNACSIRAKCKGPVPADGPIEAGVMLVGEAPGQREDERGLPFQGDAGRELDRFLEMIDLPRESLWITNTQKCRPVGNKTPTLKEAQYCATIWLQQELRLIQPRVIVAMGVIAAQYFLGDRFHSMEQDHGRPQEVDGRIVIPVYHPAAGLRQKRYMEWCDGDFRVLGTMLRGGSTEEVLDRWAGIERYSVATDEELWLATLPDVSMAPIIGIDTESLPDGSPYLISWSAGSGIGRVATAVEFQALAKAIDAIIQHTSTQFVFHNATYDLKVLASLGIYIPISRVQDTMLMAHLLQLESRGLKELAHRYCGMEMREYQDLVRLGQLPLSTRYLEGIVSRVWSWPEETLGPRGRKKSIESRAAKILADVVNRGADPWARWWDVEEELREVVERELGAMPQAGLDTAPWEDVVRYSARDADATLRLYHVLRGMLA